VIRDRVLRNKVRSIEVRLADLARQRADLTREWECLEEERMQTLRELDTYNAEEAFSDRLAG